MNFLIISLYTKFHFWLNLPQHIMAQLAPMLSITKTNFRLYIAIWGLLVTNFILNDSLFIMFWAVTITSIGLDSLLWIRWKKQTFLFVSKNAIKWIFPWNLPTTRYILLCDQTKENIIFIIISSAFFVLNWGGGSTYMEAQLTPLIPYNCVGCSSDANSSVVVFFFIVFFNSFPILVKSQSYVQICRVHMYTVQSVRIRQ